MKSLYHFLVRVPKITKDTIELNGEDIYIDTKWDEFAHRTMEGEVVALPVKFDTNVKVGDTMYFHHHVVLGGNHMMMNEETVQLEETKKRGQFINPDDDIYVVHYGGNLDPISCQAYAYRCQDTGEIELISDWIFITPEPEEEQEETIKSDIIELIPKANPPKEKKGYIRWSSPKLKELELNPGDKVLIRKNSSYEMEVNGEKLWRTYLQSIHGKIEEV